MESTVIKRKSFRLTAKAKDNIAFGICLLCLFLFALSAYDKLADHQRFLTGLLKVKFIGAYAPVISWAAPLAEIMVCLLLLYPPSHRWGLYGFIGLMTVFTLYIGSMLLWAEKLPCHCNLILEKLSFAQHLAFNIGFIALALFALWLKHNKNK